MKILLRQLLLAVLLAQAPLSALAASANPLPAQAWQRKAVGFGIGLYYLKTPASDPAKAARSLAADKRFGLRLSDTLDKSAQSQALLTLNYSSKVATDYAPPSLDMLHYFGRGLSREQAEALQKAPRALILGFAHPASQSIAGLRRAEEFVLVLARRDNAIIWDDETREAFTPDAWENARLKTWQDTLPDVSKQIVIHAYNNDGHTRAITLGMARFGLPDLVINDSVWSLNRPLGSAINALAQQLVESGPPDARGELSLKLAGLRHTNVRKLLNNGVLSGGKGEARLRLLETPAEEGDPDNALAAFDFSLQTGPDNTARQVQFVRSIFGAQPDEVIYTKHDAALKAASERARAQLPALQKAFARGLAPAEQIHVKAPFATRDGGREWMWVEITEWKGEQIKGMLRSDPRQIPGLKAGQMVEVRQSELFDYLRVFPDGRTEGNETSKLLEAARR
ncbi:DUF2314 domain-containing protein [Uliginosibacterium sp. 31-16]|uniref:DUF2314 domain-containing protein n=1 Tax=Uliginosibacterium sp. 31-16 TaxID=3068315 RepID=UPI002740222A|nr:DUF2314 domain-containing protein [Uliginosibacterium sp. 31-16]MDP5239675.1 DUF2314 domain-containing protein [Uliginosibacterium sp. 31-16]